MVLRLRSEEEIGAEQGLGLLWGGGWRVNTEMWGIVRVGTHGQSEPRCRSRDGCGAG